MKKTLWTLLLFATIAAITACDMNTTQSSDEKLNQKQEQLMDEATRQVGMPAIKNFQERKLMKMIIELRDQENIINYAYLWNEMNGKLVFIGKCVGYGLPYATQFTNPQKFMTPPDHYNGYQSVPMPQADPNGLFMPSSAEGTWIMLIDPSTNEPHPVYIEPKVIVSPFKLL